MFRFWESIGNSEQSALLTQAESIDLELVSGLAAGQLTATAAENVRKREPIDVLRLDEDPTTCSRDDAVDRGETLLRAGKVGVFLVAGGQGSRLGFSGPKGCLRVGPLSGRTLFELHAGKIHRLSLKHGVTVPWYIMTGPQNDTATRDFFATHDFFGLDQRSVFFMPQSTLPGLDDDGRLILETKSRVFENPDGHGGSYSAFRDHGGLDDAVKRGIEHVFYFQVDNPLVRIADPLFIGLHDLSGSEMSLKVVDKTDPEEKVGVVALEDGVPKVVEYSNLSEEEAHRRDGRGRLVYWAGNIAIHVLRVDFMSRVARGEIRLPYHVARKDIECVDDRGQSQTVKGRKFETFVFDALPTAENVLSLEVAREREFGPIKNRSGVDSLETAQKLLIDEHRRWLADAGVKPEGRVEVSPRAALDERDLAGSLEKQRGTTLRGDVRIEVDKAGKIVLQ